MVYSFQCMSDTVQTYKKEGSKVPEEKMSRDLNGGNSSNSHRKGETTMSTEEKEQKRITRREFVKGAAIGAAGVAAAGVLASCGAEATPCPPAPTAVPCPPAPPAPTAVPCPPYPVTGVPEKWDKEVDVVVVGSGTVLVGALAAYDSGAEEVLILEKMPTAGGSTIMSGGMFWIPNNSIQREAGYLDSREEAITYLTKAAQGTADPGWTETFVDKGPEMVDYLRENTPLDLMTDRFPDYQPEWPGGKDTRSLDCKPGFVAAYKQGKMVAHLLIGGLLEACEKRKIEILFETPAKKLVARALPDGRSEVLGLVAESEGKQIYIKARKAVILGAGGFPFNEEMCKHFLNGPFRYPFCNPGNTGDGILMGMAVGADLRNMNSAWGMPCHKGTDEKIGRFEGDRAKPGCIMVNKYGERFVNESANYNMMQNAFYRWDVVGCTGFYPNIPSFAIVDATFLNRYGFEYSKPGEESPLVRKANTLRELASKLDIDPDGLEKTVEEFNKYAKEGKDLVFHRGESAYDIFWSRFYAPAAPSPLAPIETPPFYGSSEIWPGGIGTRGGLAVNTNAQVLNPFGDVIPRLYASGNNSGVGAPGAGYGGAGGTMGPAMTFAYIAGKHTGTLKPWA